MRPRNSTIAAAIRGDQPAFGVTCVHFAPSSEDQTAELAEWPSRRPLYQPPIIHIRFLKAMLIGRSLCSQGASLVTCVQVLPSPELQTSRGGAAKELNHPPKIHMRSL